jgi:hypothetical protein
MLGPKIRATVFKKEHPTRLYFVLASSHHAFAAPKLNGVINDKALCLIDRRRIKK